MKKIIICMIIVMNSVTVNASMNYPKYQIIANSNSEEDIKELYTIKNELLINYSEWVKSVDNEIDVLIDHLYVYDAVFYNGVYKITLGDGEGKTISGDLKVSYCTTTNEITKKSWFLSLFE